MIAVSIVLFIATFSIRALLATTIGPEVMPRIASVILFLSGVGIVAEGLISARKAVAPATVAEADVTAESRTTARAGMVNMYLSIALIALYVMLMAPIGFLLSTFFYVFVQEMILAPVSKRNPFLFLIVAALTSAIIYFGFVYGLELILPSGILG